LPAVIIGFWVVMMAGLAYREGYLPFLGGPRRAPAPRSTKPSDTWMGIYTAGGSRVGFVNTTTFPDSRDNTIGISTNVTSQLDVTLLSMPMKISIAGSAFLPMEKGIADFNFQVRSGEHTMRVAGAVKDGMLDASVFTAGEEIPLKLPVGDDLFIAGGMGSTTLNVPSLRVGDEVLVDTFDPMTLSAGKARVKCVGEEVLDLLGERVRTKVIVTNIQGLTSKAWVTADEEVVRAETPLGLYLQKIAPEEAMMSAKSDGAPAAETQAGADLIQAVAVKPSGKTPHRGAARMTVRITSVGPRMPMSDDVQSVEGDQITIAAPAEPAGPVAVPDGMGEFLGGDALIQAGHPRIKEMAAQIVGGETDLWRKARKIHDWVFENIEKVPVFSIPSALETLETRQGDCNEHAVLYTALARAAGVPARVACGLVWSDELQGFYYHAWPEVWAGNWVWVDPTFGQPVADATHIKLVSGSIEQWPQLAPYLGQLQLEVLEVE
jgi:hypothetical protein